MYVEWDVIWTVPSLYIADTSTHQVWMMESGWFISFFFGSQGDEPHQFQLPFDVCYLSSHFSPSPTPSPSPSTLSMTEMTSDIWSFISNCHSRQPVSPIPVVNYARGFARVCLCIPLIVGVVQWQEYSRNVGNTNELHRGIKGSGMGEFDCPTGMCVNDAT